MHALLPEFEGKITAPQVPVDFISRVAERVRTGIFVPGNRRRADYTIDSLGADRIAFRAANLATASAIGLNEVVVERTSDAISYRVRYWTWTLCCVGLSGMLFAVLAAYRLLWARDDIQTQRYGPLFYWSNAAFWGLAWPWILTAFHKRFAARCLERLLRELLPRQLGA